MVLLVGLRAVLLELWVHGMFGEFKGCNLIDTSKDGLKDRRLISIWRPEKLNRATKLASDLVKLMG